AGPYRPDRAARHNHQPRRRRVGQSGPADGGTTPVGRLRAAQEAAVDSCDARLLRTRTERLTRRRSRWRSSPSSRLSKDRPRHSPATSGTTLSPKAKSPLASALTPSASVQAPAAPGTPTPSARPSTSPKEPGSYSPGAATSSRSAPATSSTQPLTSGTGTAPRPTTS